MRMSRAIVAAAVLAAVAWSFWGWSWQAVVLGAYLPTLLLGLGIEYLVARRRRFGNDTASPGPSKTSD
jgi:hypothetical protein